MKAIKGTITTVIGVHALCTFLYRTRLSLSAYNLGSMTSYPLLADYTAG